MRKKHVRSVGDYSGRIYGCVRYVLRVARADSGWGVRERSEPFFLLFSKEEKASLLLLRVPLLLLPLLLLLLRLYYVLLVGPARCFFFNSNSSAKAIWLVDVVQNTQKSNVYEYETKTCM